MQGLLMDSKELSSRIAAYNPDLVGITAMTPTVPEALRVAGISKSVVPGAKVVLGGVHPTLDPSGVLADENVDYVIRGEGEEAFAALAAALADGRNPHDIDGISYRKGGELVIKDKAPLIADLNKLPMPTMMPSRLRDT
jgi:radical SAM superfamily enzyme YgiQ (UPF0313 family)